MLRSCGSPRLGLRGRSVNFSREHQYTWSSMWKAPPVSTAKARFQTDRWLFVASRKMI